MPTDTFIEISGALSDYKVPSDKKAPLVLKVTVANTADNRIALAMIGSAGVTITGTQADIEAPGVNAANAHEYAEFSDAALAELNA